VTERLLVAALVFAVVAVAVALWRRPPRRLAGSSLASLGIREPAVVQFTTAGCGSCKAAAPTLRATARRASIGYHQVDVGERPEVARTYGIRRVPTIAVAGRGGRVVGVWTAVSPEIDDAARAATAVGT
jgi:thiol-disulfide isomerase/thioredoxin